MTHLNRLLLAAASNMGRRLFSDDVEECLCRLPQTLSEIYEIELRQILDEDTGTVAKITFSWLLYAARPLTGAELLVILQSNMAVGVNMKGVEEACQPFAVSNLAHSSIQLVHISVFDFLSSHPWMGFISRDIPASQCLGCLIRYYKQKGPPLFMPRVKLGDHGHSFIRCACEFWGDSVKKALHARLRPTEDIIELLMHDDFVQDSANVIFRPVSPLSPEERVHSTGLHLAAFFGFDWAIRSLLAIDPTTPVDVDTE